MARPSVFTEGLSVFPAAGAVSLLKPELGFPGGGAISSSPPPRFGATYISVPPRLPPVGRAPVIILTIRLPPPIRRLSLGTSSKRSLLSIFSATFLPNTYCNSATYAFNCCPRSVAPNACSAASRITAFGPWDRAEKGTRKGDRFIFRDYASVCPDLVVQPAALGFFLFHPRNEHCRLAVPSAVLHESNQFRLMERLGE